MLLINDNLDEAEVLFRGNSVATKALDFYMKLTGSQYLLKTLGSKIKDIYELKKPLEVMFNYIFIRSNLFLD